MLDFIREMQLKSPRDTNSTTQPLRLLQFKSLTVPSADKDVEQLEFSYTAIEKAKQHSHFGKQFGNFIMLNTHLP